jgi:GH43 family beta-xylosidase
MLRVRHFLAFALLAATSPLRPQATAPAKAPGLKNPLLPSGPDPWVASANGYFYMMVTTGKDLKIWKTRNMADLRTAESKVVWQPPATGPYSRDIWAPELHFLDGKWYIYFAADSGRNETHRIYVLEGCATDPLGCSWSMKGKVADATDRWAIDATVFEDGGKTYLLWSGWPGVTDGTQNIYIAQLSNPWTVESKRVQISTPQYKWEKVGDRPDHGPHLNVNEGPEALIRNGRIFIVYSASACWTDSYALGMLTAKGGGDLLKPKSWVKTPSPVFSGDAGAYSPGHNGFFQGADGKDWIVYHANSRPGQGCGDTRNPRAQPFGWKPDGTPDFGTPVGVDTVLPRP